MFFVFTQLTTFKVEVTKYGRENRSTITRYFTRDLSENLSLPSFRSLVLLGFDLVVSLTRYLIELTEDVTTDFIIQRVRLTVYRSFNVVMVIRKESSLKRSVVTKKRRRKRSICLFVP